MLFENSLVRSYEKDFGVYRHINVPDFGSVRVHEDFLPTSGDYCGAQFYTTVRIDSGSSGLSVDRGDGVVRLQGPLEPGELANLHHPDYEMPIVVLDMTFLALDWKPGIDTPDDLPDGELHVQLELEYDHALSVRKTGFSPETIREWRPGELPEDLEENERVHSFADGGFTVDYDSEVSHDAGWSLSLPGPVSTVLPFEDDLMVVLEPEQLDAGNEFGATPTRNLVRVSSAGGIEWVAEETDREHAYRYPVMKEGELFAKARDMVDLDAATGTVEALY
ncbi:hypothetical protein [Halostella pelagica]|uniref:hypothetical protein n=1 Tax=Halostella pelagica TaxID=2583824 RepID=UPI001081A181|nr:hypothetical protein [Halostella pelagica]